MSVEAVVAPAVTNRPDLRQFHFLIQHCMRGRRNYYFNEIVVHKYTVNCTLFTTEPLSVFPLLLLSLSPPPSLPLQGSSTISEVTPPFSHSSFSHSLSLLCSYWAGEGKKTLQRSIFHIFSRPFLIILVSDKLSFLFLFLLFFFLSAFH